MKKSKFRKIMYILTMIASISGIIFLVAHLVKDKYFQEKEDNLMRKIQLMRQESESNNLIEQVVDSENENILKVPNKPIRSYPEIQNKKNSKEQNEKLQEKQILTEYTSLYEENDDMYGWIGIEGTVIDYPVMYTPEEPNFYENKNWNKEICNNNVGTSIWIDGRTKEDSENIIVYGHNRKNLTMFGSLKNYKEESYYKEHKYIEFDTLYEKQTYEIISVSKAVIYYENKPKDKYLFYEHIELDSEEEFNDYITNAKENAWYEIQSTAEYGDKIITLCTCDYWTENARLIIIAKKIS